MKLHTLCPSGKETTLVLAFTFSFLLLTGLFVGIRAEHLFIAVLFLLLFFAGKAPRKLAVAILPFIVFGISYDWMRVYPNYMVNHIDIQSLYEAEKSLFGINTGGERLIPCEYFALHHHPVADFFAGLFYLTWVPVPIAFGLWLYLSKSRELYLHFALVFLFVNLIGFAGYYIHPAAPPWYAIHYGFEPVLHTPGNPAGLARFDEMLGVGIFDSIYSRNSNVFAAVPSLHAAYMVIALFYAIARRCHWIFISILTILMLGIWSTAVYSCHHYIIDVLLGIFCALAGILIFEKGLMRIKGFGHFMKRYSDYIK